MPKQKMEIEIRARLGSSDRRIQRAVAAIPGARKIGTTEEFDRYIKHRSDKRRDLIFRIRRCGPKALFTLKAKARGKDTAWADVDMPVEDPRTLETLLLENAYKIVVDIHKQRTTYKWKSFEINVDRIRGLGWFIEVEGRGTTAQRSCIEQGIMQLFERLCIPQKQIVHQGYVPLMIAQNAEKARKKRLP